MCAGPIGSAETRYPTFLGGLEQALPHMVAGKHCETLLVSGLRAAVGSMAGPECWADLLATGSHTVKEFRDVWGSLDEEAPAIWGNLGEEPSRTLTAPLEGVGSSTVDGSTRTKTAQQFKGIRHQLLL